eukprot:scaffold2963_cov250-Pinguiococcus_pyrenoidosus.AAC.36
MRRHLIPLSILLGLVAQAQCLQPLRMMAGFGSKGAAPKVPKDALCVCGSQATYQKCCKALHDGGVAESPEALLRARYSAYIHRLPEFLLQSQLRYAEQQDLEDRAKTKRQFAAEKKELLAYMTSLDFSDLKVHQAEELGPDVVRIPFECQLKSKGFKDALESKFLDENVVTFREASVFRKLGKRGWFYEEGQVEYDGKTLEEEFKKKGEDFARKELGVAGDASA